jgi:hypothetical protein
MDENLSIRGKIEEIIEKEIMNNLRVKLGANYWGILHLKVFYKDKLICDDAFGR